MAGWGGLPSVEEESKGMHSGTPLAWTQETVKQQAYPAKEEQNWLKYTTVLLLIYYTTHSSLAIIFDFRKDLQADCIL